jgi:hypothetical protein
MTDRQQEIAAKAYRIWEEAGRPDGREQEHWTAAEAELGPEAAPETADGAMPSDGHDRLPPETPAADESVPPAIVANRSSAGTRRRA